jgi:hypothetical protein
VAQPEDRMAAQRIAVMMIFIVSLDRFSDSAIQRFSDSRSVIRDE